MHLKTTRVRSNGKVYQYAQFVESYRREDGMPTQRVVANLGPRSELEIANLKRALEASRSGRAVVVEAQEITAPSCEVLDNFAYLDVAVVLALLARLGVGELLTALLPRAEAEVPDADVVLALVTQRCVAPDSKLAATEWFPRTALPELLGLPPERFNNSRVHRVLTGLEACEEALQARLASAVVAQKGPLATLFLDLTDTWFVGRGPSLATEGKTKEGLYRHKVGIALLCDQDGYPLRWSVVEGRRHDSGPMTEMAVALQAVDWAQGVPLVLDRAMGATAQIEELLATGRPFLTALTRNEFDVYTDRVPWSALTELPWSTPDAALVAGQAAANAGLTKVRDDLYVLDLGVVTRKEPDAEARLAPIVGADKCRDRMNAAITMNTAIEAGVANNLAEAGRPFGLSVVLACQTMRLLRLAPDLQESVMRGEAAGLSVQDLQRLAKAEDFEVQRRGYAAVLTTAKIKPDGRRGHKAGRLSAAPPSAPFVPGQATVRAVLAFNPEQWVNQKETSDRRLAEIREWTRHTNRRLLDARYAPSEAALVESALQRLRRDHLVGCFHVSVRTEAHAGRKCHQIAVEPDSTEWALRQRFHGFQILIARPEDTRPPEDLVRLFRSKDAVEKDFQTIKSALRLRPVRHRTDAKVRAHVTLCMLALLVERVMEQALKGKATAPAALEVLAEVQLNRLKTHGSALPVYALTRSKQTQLDLLGALKLQHLAQGTEVTAALQPR